MMAAPWLIFRRIAIELGLRYSEGAWSARLRYQARAEHDEAGQRRGCDPVGPGRLSSGEL